MFSLILIAINIAILVAGAAGEKRPGTEGIEDLIPCG
jgi:hypothetical protein